ISDLVADIRASTPSNAIEISTPNINDLRQLNDNLIDNFNNRYKIILSNKTKELEYIKSSFNQHSLKNRFDFIQTTIEQLRSNFNQILKSKITLSKDKVLLLKNNFLQNNPNKRSKIGLVQVTKENKLFDINKSQINELINLETPSYKFKCKIIEKQKLH
ncbi:MAG: exodeoxyribonuclease VII large subunit, partial [Arcobacteraceae bacterium]|nr:exodeoxyribonuclease VII large subunit [Arcobacteraceae bacterium]